MYYIIIALPMLVWVILPAVLFRVELKCFIQKLYYGHKKHASATDNDGNLLVPAIDDPYLHKQIKWVGAVPIKAPTCEDLYAYKVYVTDHGKLRSPVFGSSTPWNILGENYYRDSRPDSFLGLYQEDRLFDEEGDLGNGGIWSFDTFEGAARSSYATEWAWRGPTNTYNVSYPYRIVAKIRIWGTVIGYEQGWRSSHFEIVELSSWESPEYRAKMANDLGWPWEIQQIERT